MINQTLIIIVIVHLTFATWFFLWDSVPMELPLFKEKKNKVHLFQLLFLDFFFKSRDAKCFEIYSNSTRKAWCKHLIRRDKDWQIAKLEVWRTRKEIGTTEQNLYLPLTKDEWKRRRGKEREILFLFSPLCYLSFVAKVWQPFDPIFLYLWCIGSLETLYFFLLTIFCLYCLNVLSGTGGISWHLRNLPRVAATLTNFTPRISLCTEAI